MLSAIRNTTGWLEEGYDGAEEALKFLIHFVGDLHQPLHLTGRDKGGNGAKVRFDGRITSKYHFMFHILNLRVFALINHIRSS